MSTAIEAQRDVVATSPLVTVIIARDDGRYMAKCLELDLVTEMDTAEAALKAMVEMIREYAADFLERQELFLRSPNRAHHKPYVDRIAGCKEDWEIMS
ncbi:MAG: hypothetical protein HY673_04400 [Chloroflexi bacterium]|nr:hypothetical protein [Chloroflexota bacterium]